MKIDAQLLRNTIDAMEHIFYITDTQGIIEYVNPAFETQTGYTAEEVLGKNASIMQGDTMPVDYYDRLWKTISAGKPWSEVIVNRRKNGELYYAQQIITSVTDNRGNITKFSAIQQDITEREQQDRVLKKLTRDYEQIFNNTQDAIFLIDVDREEKFYFRRLNATHEKLTGMKTQDVAGKTPVEVLGQELGDVVAQNYTRCVQAKETITYEEKLDLPGGVRFWQTRLTPVIEKGRVVQIVGVARDITRRHELAQEIDILFRVSPDMFCVASFDGRFLEISPAWQTNTGWGTDELQNQEYLEYIHPDDRDATMNAMDLLSKGEVISSFDTRFRCKNGSWLWISWTSYPLTEDEKVYAVARNVQKRKEMEAQLVYLSTRDPLLGIYNRAKGMDLLMEQCARSSRYDRPFSLIMADIDHFKRINDTHGHAAGDAVLRHFCRMVDTCIRQTDFFCRWGGEEFLILCTETDEAGAARLAERIRSTVESMPSDESEAVTVSFGVAQQRGDEDVEGLLRVVDACLYDAKKQGRNSVVRRS
ncbi:sensor domain-containing diguanylate cyclase [Chitinivibrio alkaliphilus]|uniref:Diguanylate cyclase with PAS/PAC sensor n=1 Tax=Chitinivibrio alkaliphilus ACht1 TaxID=1313304 RepID=U7D5L7_9BACT|nr:PAS domain S-box protein [Chitinivibrio alkaliphilus]ERP30831.1 diguanylate cyclase with PAS/PAC sensor [Chitinivibrio alkaliphilus ACht1]